MDKLVFLSFRRYLGEIESKKKQLRIFLYTFFFLCNLCQGQCFQFSILIGKSGGARASGNFIRFLTGPPRLLVAAVYDFNSICACMHACGVPPAGSTTYTNSCVVLRTTWYVLTVIGWVHIHVVLLIRTYVLGCVPVCDTYYILVVLCVAYNNTSTYFFIYLDVQR